MTAASVTRQRVVALSAAGLLLVAAVLTMAFVARSSHDRPEPIRGLTDAQVAVARAHGLEVRPNRIATEAAQDDAERAAVAALGQDTFDALRSSVRASLARVLDDGDKVGRGLVWVVFTDEVPGPSISAGESSGVAKPSTTLVVVDPDSFDVIVEE